MAMTVSHLQEYGEKWCLLNVALTIKDFLDVALDELWEDMDSLCQYWNCYPLCILKTWASHTYVQMSMFF